MQERTASRDVERNSHGANLPQCEKCQNLLGRIFHQHRDMRSFADAAGEQAIGDAVRCIIDLSIAELAAIGQEMQKKLIAVAVSLVGQYLAKGELREVISKLFLSHQRSSHRG